MVTFQLPSGPKNLQEIFPSVDFARVDEYYLQLRSKVDASIIMTTNRFERGCCCNADSVRLFFVNYLGGIDAVNFTRVLEETEVTSSRWRKPLKYPLKKWDGGTQRKDVSSNETLTLRNSCYAETDQDWLKELLATPAAWIQWLGTQGQDDQYLPVIIADGKFVTRKEVERYVYVMELKIEMANDNITVRS